MHCVTVSSVFVYVCAVYAVHSLTVRFVCVVVWAVHCVTVSHVCPCACFCAALGSALSHSEPCVYVCVCNDISWALSHSEPCVWESGKVYTVH